MKQSYLILLGLIWLASACASLKPKYFMYVSKSYLPQRRGFPEHTTIDSIMLDSTFQLYVRRVCRPKPPMEDFFRRSRPNEAAPAARCDCAASSQPDTLEQLELQYLLLSQAQGQLIYITGIPPYLIGGKSHFNRPLSRLESFANLSEMNTFFFGELPSGASAREFRVEIWRKGAKIAKTGENLGREHWYFEKDPSGEWLTLQRVEQEQVGTIVASEPHTLYSIPLRFHRVSAEWKMGLSRDFNANVLAGANAALLKPRTIYLLSRAGKFTQVAFRFATLYQREEVKDKVGLYFDGYRVKAHPNFKPRTRQPRPLESAL